jgi:hypothetical protein
MYWLFNILQKNLATLLEAETLDQEKQKQIGITTAGLPDFCWLNIPKREIYTK